MDFFGEVHALSHDLKKIIDANGNKTNMAKSFAND
jgi:hypothetical protein